MGCCSCKPTTVTRVLLRQLATVGAKLPSLFKSVLQHLLTERLFRTVLNNPDFARRNIIAAEIEKPIDALASRKTRCGESPESWACRDSRGTI